VPATEILSRLPCKRCGRRALLTWNEPDDGDDEIRVECDCAESYIIGSITGRDGPTSGGVIQREKFIRRPFPRSGRRLKIPIHFHRDRATWREALICSEFVIFRPIAWATDEVSFVIVNGRNSDAEPVVVGVYPTFESAHLVVTGERWPLNEEGDAND
jgi:hypothetical protein